MKRHHIPSIALFGLLIAGCGGAQSGKVSGKVNYNGQPLAGGTVMFWPQAGEGKPVSAAIQADGTYTAAVPVGEVVVTVETESVSGKAAPIIPRAGTDANGNPLPGGPPPEVMEQIKAKMDQSGIKPAERERGNYVAIDAKYSKPDTSGLKTTIQSGDQKFDIDLK